MVTKKTTKKSLPSPKYFEAMGRRKTAIARVRIWPNNKNLEIFINGKNLEDYLKEKELQNILLSPFVKTGIKGIKVTIKVFGSGLRAQSFAIRHGLSRALIMAHPEVRSVLKTLKFLTRDSRMKERKKPGLKGARRAPQWSKR